MPDAHDNIADTPEEKEDLLRDTPFEEAPEDADSKKKTAGSSASGEGKKPADKKAAKGSEVRERIKGVFSSQSIQKVGTGTTVRRTIQKTFWMVEEDETGNIQVQPLNVNCVPSGPKRSVPKEDLLRQFNPEPEFYVESVYPAMQKLNESVKLGEDHRSKGRSFSAEHEFQNALSVDEENVRANFGLGLTYLERGERNKADNIFERLVNLDAAFEPEHKHLFNDFGINLRKNKMYEQAVTYYNRALELSKADEHLHYNIGRAYFALQNLNKVVEHLKTALEMNPDFEVAQQFLTWLQEKQFLNEDGTVNPNAKFDPEANGPDLPPRKADNDDPSYNVGI